MLVAVCSELSSRPPSISEFLNISGFVAEILLLGVVLLAFMKMGMILGKVNRAIQMRAGVQAPCRRPSTRRCLCANANLSSRRCL